MSTAVQPQPSQSASAPEVTQEGRYGVQNVIDDIVNASVKQSVEEQAPAPETPTRDEKGRFVSQNPEGEHEQPAPVADAAPAEESPYKPDANGDAAPEGETAESVELPEGYVALPSIDGRPLAAPFTVKDAEGELEIPDIQITFTANGKERTEALDKVVKFAQWGVYNHEREQAAQQVKADNQTLLGQNQQLLEYAKRLEQEREFLMSSDEAYLTARARYEEQNTPEARIERERAEAQRARDETALVRVAQQGEQFFSGELVPTIGLIREHLPHITEEDIGAKLTLELRPYYVNTAAGPIIPPRHYQHVRQVIVESVLPWAQQVNHAREETITARTRDANERRQAAEAEARTAQTNAQKKTNLATRPAKPMAGKPGATREAPAPKPIKTVQDAEESALAATLAQTLGTG